MTSEPTMTSNDAVDDERAPTSRSLAHSLGEARWRLPRSPFPMWVVDLQSRRIVAANVAAARAYGWALDALLAQGVDDLCPPHGGAPRSLPIRERDATPRRERWTHRRRDGSTFVADVSLIDVCDDIARAVIVFVHRHVADEQPSAPEPEPPRRPSDAPDGDPSTGERTLRGGARALAHALLPELAVPGAASCGRLVAALGSRRGATGRLFEPVSEVDARALTQAACERLRGHLDAEQIDVVFHGTAPLVRVEAEAFSRALFELVDNAVRATPRGHPIVVETRQTDDGDVKWQIQDLGGGMSSQALEQLGQRRSADAPEGRGLGVLLAWAVVDRHGGSLRFESALGVGTTATITVPGPGVAPT